jgi:tyrosine-protein phosphatase YwqE
MSFFSRLFSVKSSDAKVKMLGNLAFLGVDIHNHLLPGIDDGSQSVEQSLALVKGLNHLGFDRFICTPHIMEGVYPNTKATISQSYQTLRKGLETAA